MPDRYDFSGYATKNDLLCQDGRTIRKDAFKECDGLRVPLVWNHKHGGPGDVLGHADLENREDGVYTYGTFNETEAGKNAKELVRHGDVTALSIYANQLVQKGGNVLHGMIREVSLCLAGANPGARIEDLCFEHDADDDSDDFEALVFNGNNIELELEHSEDIEKPSSESVDEETVALTAEYAEEVIQHSSDNEEDKTMADQDKTVQDVFNEFTDEQKEVVYYMIGAAVESAGADKDEEETEMSHNVFDNDTNQEYMAHAAMSEALDEVVNDMKKYGTLRKSYEHHMQDGGALAHAIDTTGMTVPSMTNVQYAQNVGYGINGIEFMFPEARMIDGNIPFIQRDQDWVNVVLNGTHKTAFAKVKSIFANITEDEARAKGYIKANEKKNEFFTLIKRTTEPKTIYKKQKLDRDDIIDITDFDVVQMLRGEMRLMLNEEVARAILIGDGRQISDPDKIDEDKIRPIATDAPLFTIKATVAPGANDEATAKNMIKTALKARKNYKGSGNPTLFTSDDNLTNLMLIEDGIGHNLYRNETELAAAMRVKNIVTSPVMENAVDENGDEIMGVIVNLIDYNVGTNKGGEVNMFDDFDIDVNQYIYLIETRMSGALTKPFSAITLVKGKSNP